MTQYINKQLFYIDTHNKLGSSISNSEFDYVLDIRPELGLDTVVVLNATIKKSFWLVQAGQNTFTLIENGTPTVISVALGNYSASSFRTIMTALLNASSPNHYTYAITMPNAASQPDTGLFTYTVQGNSGATVSLQFTTYVYELFGFEPNSTNSFTSSITSTNVCNFQLKDKLFLHSDLVTGRDNILQEMISIGPNFSSIAYVCPDIEAYSKPLNNGTNNVFHFVLMDDDNNKITVTLNMLLTVMMYKRDRTNEVIRDYVRLKLLKPEPKRITQN